jgi:molecular chaperone DnaK
MVREAESHAEEDKKRRESVEMRNTADQLAFSTEKLLDEHDAILSDDVKDPVKESLATLTEALKGTDNDEAVKAAMDDLNTKAAAMGQAVYAAAQQNQEASAPTEESDQADDVVDAEIVDDEKK